MGLDTEGAASATHRPWVCTPKMRAPRPILGQGFLKRYVREFASSSTNATPPCHAYPTPSYHILTRPSLLRYTLPHPGLS